MNYLVALMLSAVFTNGVHGYLLLSQRTNRRFSISEHASLHAGTHLLYIVGHIFGGLFFLVYAKSFFVSYLGFEYIFWLALAAVGFEYLQAIIPARGRYNRPHIIFALLMWSSMLLLLATSFVLVPLTTIQYVLSIVVIVGIIWALLSVVIGGKKLYASQMIMVTLFYVAMFVISL